MKAHPTAIIHTESDIDDSVEIGPNVIIEKGVRIGPNNRIMANVYIAEGTEIGANNEIHFGAIIGHRPQHLQHKNQPGRTLIGNGNIIREYSTIHRGFLGDAVTKIGDHNYLMATAHVAHDCKVGNEIVLVNGVLLAGHVLVEDKAFISGNVCIHQYVRIGTLAMISGLAGVGMDVPPYMTSAGRSLVRGLNMVGLRRAGMSQETRDKIKWAYKILYHQGLNVSQALKQLEQEPCPEVQHLVEFIKGSKRGICKHSPISRTSTEDS